MIAADTDHEAQSQWETVRRYRIARFVAPGRDLTDDEADAILASPQGRQVAQMMHYSAVGTPEVVKAYLDEFADARRCRRTDHRPLLTDDRRSACAPSISSPTSTTPSPSDHRHHPFAARFVLGRVNRFAPQTGWADGGDRVRSGEFGQLRTVFQLRAVPAAAPGRRLTAMASLERPMPSGRWR